MAESEDRQKSLRRAAGEGWSKGIEVLCHFVHERQRRPDRHAKDRVFRATVGLSYPFPAWPWLLT